MFLRTTHDIAPHIYLYYDSQTNEAKGHLEVRFDWIIWSIYDPERRLRLKWTTKD